MEDLQFDNLQVVLQQYGDKLINVYRQKLLQKNADNTGLLGNSLSYIVRNEDGEYQVDLNIQDYWKYVEEGRSVGRFPPIADIRNWIQTKPIIPRPYKGKLPTIESLSFLIARSIARQGIPGKHILEESLSEIEALDLLDQAVTEDLEDQVDVIIKQIK